MNRVTGQILIVTVILVFIIGLNLLLYTDDRSGQESEQTGDRSSFSSRPYGTRAFYLLLQESGYRVSRYKEPLDRLAEHKDLTALMIIGAPLPFTSEELRELEEWVRGGGQLVVIDRQISWSINGGVIRMRTYSKQWQHPGSLQPTPLTVGVGHVQLTKFARGVGAQHAALTEHIGDQGGPVLIGFRFGEGRIILLGEPYIVANNGIQEADNLILAMNIIRSLPQGVIGFDEYHHGYGEAQISRTGVAGILLGLYAYFKPTPVLWILAQLGFLVAVMIYSRARRFVRPVPLSRERRTRSLEYVASLANLAQRQGLRLLVLENISRSLRRRPAWRARTGRLPAAVSRELNSLPWKESQTLAGKNLSDHQLVAWLKRIRETEASFRGDS